MGATWHRSCRSRMSTSSVSVRPTGSKRSPRDGASRSCRVPAARSPGRAELQERPAAQGLRRTDERRALLFRRPVIRNVSPTAFAEYGGYFSYVIVGLALVAYMTRGIGAMASGMRDAQGSGSLEIMVLTPTRLPTLLVAMAFPAYVLGLITLVAYLAAGAVLGADFGNANVPAALVSLVVIVPSFIALSSFAAALVFVTRRGNPVAWALRAVSTLLGGVLYPVSVLPTWLQPIPEAIPLTHAVILARNSLLLGGGVLRALAADADPRRADGDPNAPRAPRLCPVALSVTLGLDGSPAWRNRCRARCSERPYINSPFYGPTC